MTMQSGTTTTQGVGSPISNEAYNVISALQAKDDKPNAQGTPTTDITEGYGGASTMRDVVGDVTGRHPDRPRDSGSSETSYSAEAPDNGGDHGTDEEVGSQTR